MIDASHVLTNLCNIVQLAYWEYDVASKRLRCSGLWSVLHGDQSTAPEHTEALFACYTEADQARLQSQFERALQDGTGFELELTPHDRQDHVLHLTVHPEVDEHGQATHLLGVLQCNGITRSDAAHQQQVQADLESTNQRYDVAVAGATVGLWDWDVVQGTLFWSERMRKLFGVADPDFVPTYEGFLSYVHEQDREATNAAVTAHIKHKTPYKIDYRIVQDSGEVRWIHARGQAIWNQAGEPLRMAGSVDDVTEQKRISERLRSTAAFQDLVFEKITDMVFVKDSELRIVQANAEFLSLYPPEQRDGVIGTTTFEEYDEEQLEEFVAEDRKALEDGYTETEETIDFPNGERRVLWTKKTRFEDEHGNAFVLGVARDTSEIVRTRNALQSANQELEEFAYRISHDLRSPLVSSLKLLELVREELSSGNAAAAQNMLEVAARSLQKLNNLADDVLDITRIRQAALTGEEIDIEHMLNEIWQRHTAIADENAVRLQLELNTDHPLYSDRYGTNLVLENLVSNAIKYADPDQADSWVKVSITSTPRRIDLTIEDNGIGIPLENRDKLFSMFSRFHPGVAGGSGLGLYMVSKWVTRLGGKLHVDHLEPGTRFRIDIPHIRASL